MENLQTVLAFNFTNGSSISFEFELNNENIDSVVSSIQRNFEKRIALIESKAKKYFKRSAVLSHRKLSMSIKINQKYVNTLFSGIDTSNSLLKDTEALKDLLETILAESIEKIEMPEMVEFSVN